jgi:Domain of unknown function (DUF1906)
MGVFAAGGLSPASASAASRGLVSNHVSKAGSSATKTKSKQASSSPASTASTQAMQTVEYDGYSVTVPSSWRVFHLDTDPGQCVRYDINAVYLGSPGANQNCPSNLMGRAQTITITPAGVSKSGSGGAGTQSAAAQGGLVQSPPPSVTGRRIAARAQAFNQLNQYSQASELRGTVPGVNLSVTATYGSDATAVTGYVRNIHRARSGAPESTASTTSTTSSGNPFNFGGSPGSGSTSGSGSSTSPGNATSPPSTTNPASSSSVSSSTKTKAPTATATKAPTTATTKAPTVTKTPASTLTSTVKATIPAKPLAGFDACTAPSQNAMKAWKAKYSAIGIYIGGQNMACDYGNLSAAWVKAVHAMGWSLLPIYVGLQAPCNSFQKISTATPATQGTQAADTAVGDAASFGLGQGSPIYDDMESYNNASASCKSTVLQFLDAWTKEIHAKGYVSGVYSSASTGITDLATTTTINGHALNQPDALWFALWDNKNNLTGTPYLASTKWAADRVKQYQGNQNVKVGSYTLNIDADWVGGAVSGP